LEPAGVVQTEHSEINGLISRSYRIKFANQALAAHTAENWTGKLEQYVIEQE
jgi:hypothetical protein